MNLSELTSITSLSLNETCLKQGSNVALRCNIQGFPRPRITFKLDNEIIIPGTRNFGEYVLEFYDQVRTSTA